MSHLYAIYIVAMFFFIITIVYIVRCMLSPVTFEVYRTLFLINEELHNNYIMYGGQHNIGSLV